MSKILEEMGLNVVPNLYVEIQVDNNIHTYCVVSRDDTIGLGDCGIIAYDDDAKSVCFFPREAIKSVRFFYSDLLISE